MKNTIIASLVAVAVTMALVSIARSDVSVGAQTVASHARGVQIISQSTSDLGDSAATVFTPRALPAEPWVLYIRNTGANNLTDLDITISPLDSFPASAILYIEDSATYLPLISNIGCADTLASGQGCVMVNDGQTSYGYLAIIAKSNASKTNLEIYLLLRKPGGR